MKINEIEKIITKNLQNWWSPQQYLRDSKVFYHAQIPLSALYLKEGKIQFVKKHYVLKEITTPCLLFVKELQKQLPLPFDVKIMAGSKVYVIDKFTIQDNILTELTENAASY